MTIYFDTETTGLTPGRIIELAYILDYGTRVETKNFFFAVDYVPESASKIHGITTEKLKNVIIIPSSCISQDDSGEFVYKLIYNKAEKVYIKTKDITSKGTVITSGISDGDYIISNVEDIESDGSYVRKEEQ